MVLKEKTMKFINLTPHTINEITSGQSIKPSGIVARVKSSTIESANHAGIPIYQSTLSSIAGLPDPQPGVIYIVSSLALNAVPKHRTDVVAPGNVQKDENYKPIGCCGFRR